MGNVQEAIELLRSGGVIDRLKDEAQTAREVERAELLERLQKAEKDEADRVAAIQKNRPALLERVAKLEAELADARRALRQFDGLDVSYVSRDKLRMKLRKLADPRIGETLSHLRDLIGRAHQGFRSAVVRVRTVNGKETRTESNALEIGYVVESIRAAIVQLEALEESPRPANLDAVLRQLVEPLEAAVRKLHGFN